MTIAAQQLTIFGACAFGEAANSSPPEIEALRDHVTVCRGQRGRMFALHGTTDTVSGFAITRLIAPVPDPASLAGVASMAV